MKGMLAASADYWLRQRNVEMVWCNLRTLDEVMDGTHSVFALGNDGMGVQLVFSTDAVLEADDDAVLVLTQLGYLGKAMQRVRYQEMTGDLDCYA